MRASDAERDAAIRRLGGACTEGRLTLGEFEERIEHAMAARTRGELAELLSDLPAIGAEAHSSTGLEQPLSTGLAPDARACRNTQLSLNLFGGLRRHGRWTLPRHLVHVAVAGGTTLDLSEAELSREEVTLTVVTILGGVDVRIPDALRLDVSGISILGGRRIAQRHSASPDAPLIHLRLFSLAGGIRVRNSRQPTKR